MIAVVGEALIDARADGELLQTHVGGGPYNTAVALGRLGMPTAFGGSVSRDPFGARLLAGLERARVSFTGHVVDAPTPLALVDPSVDGAARYRFYLRGTAFDDTPSPAAVPSAATTLVVGSLGLALDPAGAAVERIAACGDSGRLVVVDPNVRPGIVDTVAYHGRLERLAHAGALVKVSRDDAVALLPGVEPDDLAADLLARGAVAVVVTGGPAGASAFTRSGTVDVRAPAVDVVDTVGAGDAFTAGLLAGLRRAGQLAPNALRALRLESWRDALAYAAAAGAAQCMRASAWGPSPAEVDQVHASELVRGG